MEFYTKPRPADAGRTAYAYCIRCDAPMTGDEAALNYKFVNRLAKEFLCPVCLGERTGMTASRLRDMIVVFRKQGCRMFSPWEDSEEG